MLLTKGGAVDDITKKIVNKYTDSYNKRRDTYETISKLME